MTVADYTALLGGGAATVIMLADLAFRPRSWQLRHPERALRTQATVLGVMAFAACIPVACVIWRSVTPPAGRETEPLSDALLAIGAGVAPFILGGALGLMMAHADELLRADRKVSDALSWLVALAGYQRQQRGRTTLTFVDAAHPFACATRHPGPHVVITRGLLERLTPQQVEAVVAHEEHHLTAGHDRLLRVVRLLATCLPLPMWRSQESRVRLLIELAADDDAARRCGGTVVAEALDRMSALAPDEVTAARASRLRVLPAPPSQLHALRRGATGTPERVDAVRDYAAG